MERVHDYLVSFPWDKYAVLYGIAFRKELVDGNISRSRSCEDAREAIYTRCLYNAYLAQFILNREDIWRKMTIDQALRGTYKGNVSALQIEIDIGDSMYDHIFTLVDLGKQWYIIQSYIYEYEARIDPIDPMSLLMTLRRWQSNGVDPDEWYNLFHARVPVSYRARLHIYGIGELVIDDIFDTKEDIDSRIKYLLTNKDTYIHQDKYLCLLR